MKVAITCVAAAVLSAACASATRYTPPLVEPSMAIYSVSVPMSRDEVWSKALPKLGKRFFVINNMDKASGFMNVSYSGDPELYVDCGTINTRFNNVNGETVFDFPAARQSQRFKLMHPTQGLLNEHTSALYKHGLHVE